jgi:hypothetical protein
VIAEWADIEEGATVVEERGAASIWGDGERHETRNPWRLNAVDSGFHAVEGCAWASRG